MLNLITTRRVFATAIFAFAFAVSLVGGAFAQAFSILNGQVPAAPGVQDPNVSLSPPTEVVQTPQPSELPSPQQGAAEAKQDTDVLMRGQLHEAFAEVNQAEPKPNPVITKQPPEPIKELAPEYKPDGERVEWIPGYWAWDETRDDFIWISGIWRDVPAGQRWVPGYWETVPNGFRWVSGFWMSAQVEQVDYLPPPPASIDIGPSTPAPSEEHFYAPGSWIYQQNNYVWQPGCWMPRMENLIWVPATYIWTPAGCVFRPGYWDRLFDCRGVVFAPVCFRRPVYYEASYFYTPTCVINTNFDLFPHLFVRRHCRNYYFGDWYADRFIRNDFCAWSQISYRPYFDRCYDPLYTYYSSPRCRYNDVVLINWVRDRHDYCHRHVDYRPRPTFSLAINIHNDFGNDHHHAVLGDTFDRCVRNRPRDEHGHGGFKHLQENERREIQQSTAPIVEISRNRKIAESTEARPVEIVRAKSDNPVLKVDRPTTKLSLPQVDRKAIAEAERAANELKRRQTQLERDAKIAERRAARDTKATGDQAKKTGNQKPVLVDPNDRPRNLPRGEVTRTEAEQKSKLNPTVGTQLPGGAEPNVDRSVLRRVENERRQAELKSSQQQRELQRDQERQLEAQQRIVRQQQLSEKVRQQQASQQAMEQQRVTERAAQKQLQQQQQSQRQLEVQQRRAADAAAQQAAEQQRQMESSMRRQQAAAEQSQRQQRFQMEQQQRQAQQDQMRQQRETDRQQRETQRNQQRESRRNKDD